MLDRAVEKLKKQQSEMFLEMEPETQAIIRKGLGLPEDTEKWSKANNEHAALISEVDKLAKEAKEEANQTRKELADEKKAREGEVTKMHARLDASEKLITSFKEGGGDSAPYKLSDIVLASDNYKDANKRRIEETGKIDVGFLPIRAFRSGSAIGIEDLSEEQQKILKSISGAAGSGEALADSRRLPGVITEPNVQLNVQDLIPTTVISEGSVDFVRELVFTDNAATVAESVTAALVNKPEGDITFELQTRNMQMIAQWIAASKQILQDSNRTQLRSYIDRRLVYSIDLELEDQVLLGDGTGSNLTGLVPNATAYNGGYAQIQGADATQLDTLRRARTQARIAEYPVTGIVLHPDDWEDIELLKATDLQYIFAMPQQALTPIVWGMPIISSTRMTTGEFLVGAFSLGAELFTQGTATVEVSRAHASFFIQNMVAILAEMRALLAIYRETAFITGPFTEASGS